ncbi:hypothetical protein ACNHUS_23410 [Actinomycetes bacterium M1A6_2h]
MWWFVVGIAAVWIVVAVVLSGQIGRAIHAADIEDEVDRLRRDERDGGPVTSAEREGAAEDAVSTPCIGRRRRN